MSAFTHRGVVEGFYGSRSSHTDRLWLIERMGPWGMNRYLYAPKDDPLQREDWRAPYPPEAMREYSELVERGARVGVSVGFAVSPGLSIRYSSREDLETLGRKMRGFGEIGARFFALALDDIPSQLTHEADGVAFDSLAEAQVALVHGLREQLPADTIFWLIPTEYLHVDPSPYLEELGEKLDPSIEIGWTGRTVVSPTIPLEEARQRASTLRRRLLLWDNVPVSDGPMRCMLHMGPFVGRDAHLPEELSGILLNPMEQAHASAVTLATAADYLRDPSSYDPESSWKRALLELGDGCPEAFGCFAAGHRFSALLPNDRDPEIEAAFRELRDAISNARDARPALAGLRALVEARLEAKQSLENTLGDRDLLREIEPWVQAHHHETRRIATALDLLDVMSSGASPMAKALAWFRMEGRLTRISRGQVTSYGPRRLLFPLLVSMNEDEAGFGADPALFRDRCLADEIVRFAEDQALRLRA